MERSLLLAGYSGEGTQIICLMAGDWEERVSSARVAAAPVSPGSPGSVWLGSTRDGPRASRGKGVCRGVLWGVEERGPLGWNVRRG